MITKGIYIQNEKNRGEGANTSAQLNSSLTLQLYIVTAAIYFMRKVIQLHPQ